MSAIPHNDPPAALPRGTRLGEFELRRVLGIGGFGIVYLAFDHALEREVAIKEYMPSSLVGRADGLQLSLLSQGNAESFALGLRSFVNEARLLARFDHPSLVKVHRYWEANNTAYMVMPFYTGRNLHAVRRSMAQPPDEAWLRSIVLPLLGALERLHGEGVYHRDISPDNVILQPDGAPVLLDFGAARRVLGDKSMALTAILKPAYAPIEQYAEAGAVRQGAWTDLYSLGATLHFLLLGKAPPPATARTVDDDMLPLASQPALLAVCSADFLKTIDWLLKPRPADRPQQVAALRQALAVQTPAAAQDDAHWEPTRVLIPGTVEAHAPTVIDLSRLVPDQAAASLPKATPRVNPDVLSNVAPDVALTATRDAPLRPAPPPSAARKPVAFAAGVAALVLAGAGAAWLARAPAGPAVAGGAAAPGATAASALAEAAAPGVAPATPVAAAKAPTASAPTAMANPAPALVAVPTATPKPASTKQVANRSAASAPAPADGPATAAVATPTAPNTVVDNTPPSLATSITKLPPADTAKPNSTPAPQVAAAAVPAPALPTTAPATGAPAPAPATGTARGGDTSVARGGDTPVPRASARESEPVQLQARALGPGERCDGRAAATLLACIDRICRAEPGLREHADCVKARREAQR